LLLDVGPEADGTIPAVQLDRLKALGAWLDMNGEGIYGTRPWKRAEGETADGMKVRFTQKDGAVYAFLLGEPKGKTMTLRDVTLKAGTPVTMLGTTGNLRWTQKGNDVQVELPTSLPGKYADGLKMAGAE
jgi:alpha-L-fucosidase